MERPAGQPEPTHTEIIWAYVELAASLVTANFGHTLTEPVRPVRMNHAVSLAA